MSVVAGVLKAAAGGKMLTEARLAKKALPRIKRTLVVGLVTLFALLAFAAFMIPASQAPNAEHSYVAASTPDQSGTASPVSSEPQAGAPQMSEKGALDAYEKLPLSFVPNEGQTDKAVRYYAQGAGYGFFFTHKGATLSFADGKGHGGQALALDFLGADPDATLTAKKRLAGKVNYLVGNDPAEWRQGLPTHAELLYGGLWPGIDMAVRGEGGNLKYEFRLEPGSSVEDVRLGYRGAEGLSVGAGGQLLIQTSLGVMKDAAPVSYQRIGGKRIPVKSRYELRGDGGYGFALGAYDPRYPLIIDPGLDYSTFLGGIGDDVGRGIAVDRSGSAYVTGQTDSPNYPTTPGAFDTSLNSVGEGADAFVTKLNASGSKLDYSTFLGGTSGDIGSGIAVRFGKAYVTGTTRSADYPTTPGAFDRTFNGASDAFVTKLNASGSKLDYSTFLGGTSGDLGGGIAVRFGNAYVTGIAGSGDYPTTPGAFDTSTGGGAFVTKLNASGSKLAYSTFLGGGYGSDIAVDRSGSAYVTGGTGADYPTTSGAFDTSHNGGADAFVTKLNASGSALDYSTFLGGTGFDRGSAIAVQEGSAYVTGEITSADYPTTSGAFDTSYNGGADDAFVTKLNASGSALDYSTFLGGTTGVEFGLGIAVQEGRAYVAGSTDDTDYPTTPGAFDTSFNGTYGYIDAFVTKLPTDPSGGIPRETKVPNVVGSYSSAAGQAIRNAGLVPMFTGASPGGNAWVYSQSPAAGTVVDRGSTVTCRLTTKGNPP